VKTSQQIRKEFLSFFKEKQHAIVESAPVVPLEDPTLLFTNAGMNQFKAIFLGEQNSLRFEGRDWQRAADTQKCIRVSGKHNDLEEVGHDTYHHTLFEMLGNWSFGDYFKEEAISWAWELLVDRWSLDPNRIYVTVFGGDKEDGLPVDEEAIELWNAKTSIPKEHILKFDKTDNFWEMGDTGPCGPCSEIHYDLRSDEERAELNGKDLVNIGHPQLIEIWNLVFIQFNRKPDGSLASLPAKHVDTGMGFERLCAVLQGKKSNYDSDVFTPLLDHICALAKIKYGAKEETDIAMRVIADHIRAVSFSIADGASPGNDGRGYVIRRILRRAVRYGWDKLGLKEPFMFKLVDTLASQMAGVFSELSDQLAFVKNVIKQEENSFLRTLGQGISLFEKMAEGKIILDGDDAFKLHDTFGFPIDLTQLMARERGIEVDTEGFTRLMLEQKTRARAAGKFSIDQSSVEGWNLIKGETQNAEFIGYDELEAEVKVVAWRKDGDKTYLRFNKTPFYAESGGQVGDKGTLSSANEIIEILDVQKSDHGFVHLVSQLPENLAASWVGAVEPERRAKVEKNHSATHLLNGALDQILGSHTNQKGSYLDDTYLRFDFSHYEAVKPEEIAQIERIVNEKIQANIALEEERNLPIEEAKKLGAKMMFGEKYGDTVRVVTFGEDFSREFCGGTHVKSTGEIGYFRITAEASVASGIRRIEAVSGPVADELLRKEKDELTALKNLLGTAGSSIDNLKAVLDERKQLQKEVEQLKAKMAGGQLDELITQAHTLSNGLTLVIGEVEADMNSLKQLGYDLLNRKETNTIGLLGSKDLETNKVFLVATVTDDIIKSKSLKAGAIVGQFAKMLGGGGGGQPSLATAGGKQPEKLAEVLAEAVKMIASF
jgi:alanyl-tRNA synthetase